MNLQWFLTGCKEEAGINGGAHFTSIDKAPVSKSLLLVPSALSLCFPPDKAPVSKSLLLVPSALSLLLALVLPHSQRFFVYDLQAVKDDLQVSAAPLAPGEEEASLLSPICPPFCRSQCLIASQFIWRLISGRIICLDLKDTFCSSLLIYNFRIFERRYGSRKFASFLLGSWVLSAVGDFILVEAVGYSFGVTAARNLPSGL
ncbi:hypothetical protein Celaphus_00016800 [Cervus elaphus hippelaphus]|uniref:Uncharacterized protein n=1 Tax=Cervus elaphus hippelaphus TaxID=46360 RepID=A0A212C4U1_CEREH|nr:hypothetical protein Celaphus_00016800 [Cervus elaphus hippelaphus]